MRYEIIIRKACSAAANMAFDQKLLESLAQDPRVVLHFYDWEEAAATYGYFIKPERYFKEVPNGLQLARRPTGGGIIFHTCDLAFSLLLPASHPCYLRNPLESYAWINRKVIAALQMPSLSLLPCEPPRKNGLSDSFCMAKPTCYDLFLEGRKVGGAAQRRMKQGLLHQSSITLQITDTFSQFLHEGEAVVLEMANNSQALLKPGASNEEIGTTKQQIRFGLINTLRKELFPLIGSV